MTSLVVQWLRLHASNAGDAGSIPGQGTKILFLILFLAAKNKNSLKKKKKASFREKDTPAVQNSNACPFLAFWEKERQNTQFLLQVILPLLHNIALHFNKFTLIPLTCNRRVLRYFLMERKFNFLRIQKSKLPRNVVS